MLWVLAADGGQSSAVGLPSRRVHVVASEDLPADDLRLLARRGVVLWLRTRSNTLKDSTLEQLDRFEVSFVQVRSPVSPRQAAQLASARRVGVWYQHEHGGLQGLSYLGPRPVMVRVRGALSEELVPALAGAKVEGVEWEPDPAADLHSWAVFRQLPGRKVLRSDAVLAAALERSPACLPGMGSGRITVMWPGHARPFPRLGRCGFGARVQALDMEPAELLAVLATDVTMELELDVGADERAASRARRLLELVLPR